MQTHIDTSFLAIEIKIKEVIKRNVLTTSKTVISCMRNRLKENMCKLRNIWLAQRSWFQKYRWDRKRKSRLLSFDT